MSQYMLVGLGSNTILSPIEAGGSREDSYLAVFSPPHEDNAKTAAKKRTVSLVRCKNNLHISDTDNQNLKPAVRATPWPPPSPMEIPL